ncbi:hypothetical protein Vafri_7720 [Volvox africanus]|uniref:Hexosyltransferase n=1 Tax=Volvox africanus TaxID=51714 RepID=A0A8J4B1D8_9CHLO|nr:hypothetical protein Vafri_7720 [Volvox africanus]
MYRFIKLLIIYILFESLNVCNGGQQPQTLDLFEGARRELMDAATIAAQAQLGENNNTADKLAMMYLFTNPHSDRMKLLRASIGLSSENVFPTTPTILYVFTQPNQVETMKLELGKWLLPNVIVVPITNESWQIHPSAQDERSWHGKGWNADYRIMGNWRLGYMPVFARAMGHRYVLQIDDDSFILSPVGFNLVEAFDRKGYLMGARCISRDVPFVIWGLPELARYYLVTHKLMPTTLFEHCNPPNLTGLYSRFSGQPMLGERSPEEVHALEELKLPSEGGWDMTVLYGNWVMWRLDWWFRPEVNNFVQLALASGGTVRERWVDQAVIAMIWQIFVRKDQLLLTNFTYQHTKDPRIANEFLSKHSRV